MKFEKRTVKTTGETYYSFVRYDSETKKRIRIGREEIRNRFGRDIVTEEQAITCLGHLEAEVDSSKVRYQKRKEWQEKYYRFNELLEMYTVKRKKKAPNSWKNSVHYLSSYVLPYFLTEKKLENILIWPDHYNDFHDWLENRATLVRKPGQGISYASMNHCVKALNTFMRHLREDNIISELRLAEAFDEHLLNERTADDVVTEEEKDKVGNQLKLQEHNLEADFHRFLFFSGMRFNEAAGVSFVDVFPGEVAHGLFANLLQKNNVIYHGYILLESQPAAQNRAIRDSSTQRVPRKPLKGRKKICEKNSRVIPIVDEQVWENLLERCKVQFSQWKAGAYGSEQKDYLLFDGLNKATSMTRLKQAYEKLEMRVKTWHCLRHSRGTFLFGETGDRELAKMWLGHGSNKVFERYNHTFQQMVRNAKRPKPRREDDFESWLSGRK